MKKVFGALSSVLAVGIFLFTCQTGKANADMENVYTIEKSCLSNGMKLEGQKEILAINTLKETDNIRGAGLTINEWGYTYNAGKDNGSIIEKEVSNNALNNE